MAVQMAIFVMYFLVLLGSGYIASKLTKGTEDFYIAGGNIGWSPGRCDHMATQMSRGLYRHHRHDYKVGGSSPG